MQYRLFLTWYVLCHRSHTLPLLKDGKKEGDKLLKIDIDAMEEIVSTLSLCYEKLGLDGFDLVLDRVENYISDRRWRDRVAHVRSRWWLYVKGNRDKACESISQVDIEGSVDIAVLTLYLDLNDEQLTFDQKDRLYKRIVDETDDPDVCFQYKCALGLSRVAICETDDAIQLIEDALEEFETSVEGERSLYGNHLYANIIQQLGILKQDDDLIKESVKVYNEILKGEDRCNLTDFAIADYQSELGRCYDMLGDYAKAVECFNASDRRCPTPLTQVYLAVAHIGSECYDSARSILQSIKVGELSDVNRQDYAMACSAMAVKTHCHPDVEIAIAELKSIRPIEPYFANMQKESLIALLECKPSVEGTGPEGFLKKINRYVMLKPSFFGFGVDINNIIDDLH